MSLLEIERARSNGKRIVFVLGAGSSMHLGFPSGPGLKTELVRLLTERGYLTSFSAELGEPTLGQHLDKLGFAGADELAKALSASQTETIDTFLAKHDRFRELGRCAVLLAILLYERKVKPRLSALASDIDWYRHLFIRAEVGEWEANGDVWFITFNYDRSLETYLAHAIAADSELSFDEALEKANSWVCHVYGQPEGMAFGELYRENDIGSVAAGIRTVGESSEHLEKVRDVVQSADIVCFLGFGYDRDNVELLDVRDDWCPGSHGAQHHLDPPPRKTVVGSVYGLTEAEVRGAESLFTVRALLSADHLGLNALEFLRATNLLQ